MGLLHQAWLPHISRWETFTGLGYPWMAAVVITLDVLRWMNGGCIRTLFWNGVSLASSVRSFVKLGASFEDICQTVNANGKKNPHRRKRLGNWIEKGTLGGFQRCVPWPCQITKKAWPLGDLFHEKPSGSTVFLWKNSPNMGGKYWHWWNPRGVEGNVTMVS